MNFMNPATPGARWHPTAYSRRPFMGQSLGETFDILTVLVRSSGVPVAGVNVEVMFANGEASTGVTDVGGTLVVSYTGKRGQAVIRITPPAGVEDLGEGTAQGANLKGGPVETSFDMVAVVGASPIVGVGVAAALYGLVLAVF